MKNRCKRVLVLCLSLMLVLGSLTSPIYAEDTRMAHNIYSNPDLSQTSGGFDTFTIDFRSGLTPECTYWALCNWGMDLTGSKDLYPSASGGGAYGGLQNTANGRMGIMAFWEVSYGRGQIMRASRIFPKGAENNFGGEGEGTNWIYGYNWEDNKWYRMVIHCWEDAETGTTFVGQWFQNRESGEWTLMSYFDTHLKNSFFTGGMSQFMENYHHSVAAAERECNYKSMYVYDHTYQKWISLATTNLSYDTWYGNKKGTHEFGATDEYFWGKADGTDLADQEAYDKDSIQNKDYTINQPDTPTFGSPAIKSLDLQQNSKQWKIYWNVEKTGTPQLSYQVELIDLAGNVIFSQTETRPEVSRCLIDITEEKAVKCRLTVTDIFGETTVTETESDEYAAASSSEKDDTTGDTRGEASVPFTAIIIAVVAAVAVIAGAVVGIVLVAKKKKTKA